MTTLAEFLEAAHYLQVPLTRNGIGLFETAGTLNDRAVRVLIDTGASNTVVDMALVRELGLELLPLVGQGGGAGGASMDCFLISGAELRLGSVSPRVKELVAMDLSHANDALALHGASAVEVILGIDVFEAQAAIIDYGSAALFLRDA